MSNHQSNLKKFKEIMNALEIILFERTTFLVICSSNVENSNENHDSSDNNNVLLDPKRFEKISNIMKNFKQSCTKLKSGFKTLILNNNIYVSELSSNMVCFIVLKDMNIPQELVLENIKKAKEFFQ